jgi:phosphoglycolate phosphatase
VETSEVKRAGGVAVGLATGEPLCESVDPWKRLRLIEAGADVIVPNFRDPQRLLETLFSHHAS